MKFLLKSDFECSLVSRILNPEKIQVRDDADDYERVESVKRVVKSTYLCKVHVKRVPGVGTASAKP